MLRGVVPFVCYGEDIVVIATVEVGSDVSPSMCVAKWHVLLQHSFLLVWGSSFVQFIVFVQLPSHPVRSS